MPAGPSTAPSSSKVSETFAYHPANVCSREFRFEIEDGIIKKMLVIGGCAGNTQGVSRLSEGRKVEEVISLLEGIRCPGSRTGTDSCPNQVALALKSYLASKGDGR